MTRMADYGVVPVGGELQSFRQYIAAHRPKLHDLHIDYNCWWSLEGGFTEREALGLMGVFAEKLQKDLGVAFDTFSIDLGWSDRKSNALPPSPPLLLASIRRLST